MTSARSETDKRPILVASHPRSGTHLVIDTLRRQFPQTRAWRPWGMPTDHLYFNLERATSERRPFGDQNAQKIAARASRPILKTHYLADYSQTWREDETGPMPAFSRDLIASAQTIYVLRHPVATLRSYHRFLAGIDPLYGRMDFVAFLRSPHWGGETDVIGWWARHVSGWIAREDVLLVKYEDLTHDPSGTLGRFELFLGAAPSGVLPILPPHRKSRMSVQIERILSLAPRSTAIVAPRYGALSAAAKEPLPARDIDWIGTRIGDVADEIGYSIL